MTNKNVIKEQTQLNVGYKKIISLSIPTVIANFSVILIGIIDLYFVGRLGATAITAVSIGVTVWWTIAYFFDGLRSAMVVMVANSMGKDDRLNISHLLNAGLLLALGCGIIFLISTNFLSYHLSTRLSDDPSVISLSITFLKYLLPAAPFCLIMYVAEGFFRGIGNVFIPMILSIIVTIVSIALDWLLIPGNLGFAPMGTVGAAIATSVAHVIGGIIGLLMIIYHKESKPYFLPNIGTERQLIKYAKIAIDAGIYSGLIQVALLFFTAFLKNSGTVTQAANQIANEVFNISFLPPMGFMVTASMLVSTLVGRGMTDQINDVVKKILIVSVCSVSFISFLSFYFASQIANFFSPADAQVALMAASAIKIAALNQVFCSATLVLRGALLGIGKSTYVRYCGILGTVLYFLPVAYLVVNVLGFGLIGGYFVMVSWTALILILFGPAFWYYKNKMQSH